MFNKILIANRGEIACRIIRTARAMGIQTVAVYSAADKNSLHVTLADSAYFIGEANARESYLSITNIINATLESGAQAIHPGYGFLSENPEFARACEQNGIVFIGPSVAAMEAMASKQLAKKLLENTPVPLTPGYHGKSQDEATLLQEAQQIGFPILIKAANGGGGKGMRAVYALEEFSTELAGAQREALSSFGDDTVILEKLVTNPRHVEVQIMADNYGNVVHIFERDCSIQRRHQKIIEEAPAPGLSDTLREQLAKAACDVARSIQYRGAGTVEFLVDDDKFYFMEMNTRLQVEHPVTEMISGLDLVAWQLYIAANEPLPLLQEDIKAHGHALECRIYAEDPQQNFIPSIGTIQYLHEPQGDGVRIDTGVVQGSMITRYYDPMIAKLIVWGESRAEATQKLLQALNNYYITGVKTNIPFLQAIIAHPKFQQEQISTSFLTEESLTFTEPDPTLGYLFAAAVDFLDTQQKISHDPLYQDTFSWQSTKNASWWLRYEQEEGTVELKISPENPDSFMLNFNEKQLLVRARGSSTQIIIEYQNQQYQATVVNNQETVYIFSNYGSWVIKRFSWGHSRDMSANKNQLTAPMPATVVAILKSKGDLIKAGERLIILEAMKMEHTIHAPHDGILKDIFFNVGSQVNEGQELLSLDVK